VVLRYYDKVTGEFVSSLRAKEVGLRMKGFIELVRCLPKAYTEIMLFEFVFYPTANEIGLLTWFFVCTKQRSSQAEVQPENFAILTYYLCYIYCLVRTKAALGSRWSNDSYHLHWPSAYEAKNRCGV
jgi:hypothetical protein